MRLRKEMANPPLTPPGDNDGAGMETTGEIPNEDIMPENLQGIETAEASKMNELCGNVIENKGSTFEDRQRSGNAAGNKHSYTCDAGRGMTSREARRGQSRPQGVKAETFRPLPETPLRGRLLSLPQGRAKCAGHVRIEERSNVDLRVFVRQDVASQSNVGRTLWPNMMVVLIKMGSHSNVTQRAEL